MTPQFTILYQRWALKLIHYLLSILIIQGGTCKSDHTNTLSNQCFVKLQLEKKKVKKSTLKKYTFSKSKCASLPDIELDKWAIPLECQRPSNKWIAATNPIFIYDFWHIIKTLSFPIPINMDVQKHQRLTSCFLKFTLEMSTHNLLLSGFCHQYITQTLLSQSLTTF